MRGEMCGSRRCLEEKPRSGGWTPGRGSLLPALSQSRSSRGLWGGGVTGGGRATLETTRPRLGLDGGTVHLGTLPVQTQALLPNGCGTEARNGQEACWSSTDTPMRKDVQGWPSSPALTQLPAFSPRPSQRRGRRLLAWSREARRGEGGNPGGN